VKFVFCENFLENLSGKIGLDYNVTIITGTLFEDVPIFMIISRPILSYLEKFFQRRFATEKSKLSF